MPSRERVQGLVGLIEAGKFIEALQQFYLDDASMQENVTPPRRGLATLVAHERGVMGQFKQITARQLDGVFIAGDRVVMRWRFEFTRADGGKLMLDELSYQLWRGDRVAEERFYYDPGQLKG